MKTNFRLLGILFLGTITLSSCNKDDNNAPAIPAPSNTQFNAVRQAALDNLTQHFALTAGTGTANFTSAKGVTISLNGNCLTKNGVPVTGAVDLEYIELFDKGHMLTTNKPTMGVMANGDKNLLKSGGEFFLKATQGGIALATTCNINLIVPGTLTTATDNTMTLWVGNNDNPENLAWNPVNPGTGGPVGGNGVGIEQNNYFVSFGNFGWTNVDRFHSDPRPKTTLLAAVPTGYNNTNSAIYLSYDGEGTNALAKLDTYISASNLFSEHYGQIPIGLACHVIFATESNGQWRYAIKAVTVAAGDIYTFSLAETTVGSESQLVAAINAIQ